MRLINTIAELVILAAFVAAVFVWVGVATGRL